MATREHESHLQEELAQPVNFQANVFEYRGIYLQMCLWVSFGLLLPYGALFQETYLSLPLTLVVAGVALAVLFKYGQRDVLAPWSFVGSTMAMVLAWVWTVPDSTASYYFALVPLSLTGLLLGNQQQAITPPFIVLIWQRAFITRDWQSSR